LRVVKFFQEPLTNELRRMPLLRLSKKGVLGSGSLL
jgi:hypothetical protein